MAAEKRWRKEDPAKVRARHIKFEKAHIIQVKLALNDNTDKDIIDFLETVPSKRAFILAAIRSAMEAEQKKGEKQ